jgi:hypothetical protein
MTNDRREELRQACEELVAEGKAIKVSDTCYQIHPGPWTPEMLAKLQELSDKMDTELAKKQTARKILELEAERRMPHPFCIT